MSAPFAHTSGPRDAKLVLLGEAHGEAEEQYGVPFAGQSGRELFRMLGDAWGDGEARRIANLRSDSEWLRERENWLHAQGIFLTNVFASRPPKNNLGAWCGAKGEMERDYDLPRLRTENPGFIRSGYAVPELQRLAAELHFAPRNLVLCLGATALWALTGSSAIGALRGATAEGGVIASGSSARGDRTGGRSLAEVRGEALGASGAADSAGGPCAPHNAERDAEQANERLELGAERADGLSGVLHRLGDGETSRAAPSAAAAVSFKLLPTYHPAAVLRAWHWRPIVLADLLKCARERHSARLERPARRIIISPSIREVEEWTRRALEGDEISPPARLLAPDIETLNGQIRCIGFARSKEDVLVVPFVARLTGGSYWGDESHELRAWACVRALLESDIPKVGQNFLFDLQYLTRVGIRCRNVRHDTMLLHHALFPEMQKGLGFLGSCYTNEQSWKLMRRHKGEEELKRDE